MQIAVQSVNYTLPLSYPSLDESLLAFCSIHGILGRESIFVIEVTLDDKRVAKGAEIVFTKLINELVVGGEEVSMIVAYVPSTGQNPFHIEEFEDKWGISVMA